jgi:site-specific recombinase XerD
MGYVIPNFENFVVKLKLMGVSPIRIKSLVSHNKKFLEIMNETPETIKEDDAKNYLTYLMDKGEKEKQINKILSSLKIFYDDVNKKGIFSNVKFEVVENLPHILAKEEVRRILDSVQDESHKLLLELMYSSGLRPSDCVKLKASDVYMTEEGIFVKFDKDKKHYVILSENTISKLISLFGFSDRYLFEKVRSHLLVRDVEEILKNVLTNSGIDKKISCDTLRHSFAMHLLEQGVDTGLIEEYLGYYGISSKNLPLLKNIKSPIDDIKSHNLDTGNLGIENISL